MTHLYLECGDLHSGFTWVKCQDCCQGPGPEANDLQELFWYEVFKMRKAGGKINDTVIENMLSWRHHLAQQRARP